MTRLGKILIAISIILIIVLLELLIVLRNVPSEAISAFLGVLVGGAITGFVQYWISEAARKQELALAALDKRLQAHQMAYTLWRRLLFADKRTDEIYQVIFECQQWWDSNCLYLSADARKAFRKAYQSAGDHAGFLAVHANVELVKAAWRDVESAGPIIVMGVHLPSLGELESVHGITQFDSRDD